MTTQRFVSLCPSVTEALFGLGVGGSVVGATRFCVRPADEMDHVERVGGTKTPDLERIAALRPTLVFMNEEENRVEDARELEARGLRVHTSFPRRVDDVPGVLRSLGAAIGRPAAAESFAAPLERRLLARGGAPGPSFAVLVWRNPWMAASEATYCSSVLEASGGVNVVRTDEPYPTLELAELRELRPDHVLLPDEPYRFGEPHVEEVAGALGMSPDRVHPCDGQLLTWHGIRTSEAIRAFGGTWSGAAPSP